MSSQFPEDLYPEILASGTNIFCRSQNYRGVRTICQLLSGAQNRRPSQVTDEQTPRRGNLREVGSLARY